MLKSRFNFMIFGICMCIHAHAVASEWAQPSPRLRADAAILGRSVEDSDQQSRIVGLAIEARAHHALDADWIAEIAASAVVETGTSQALFSSEFKPANRLSLEEASLLWTPVPALALKFGALNQEFHDDPLLIQSATFPGISEFIQFGDNHKIRITAEQAVPTADSSSAQGNGKMSVPFYRMERVAFSNSFGAIALETRVSHFSFQGLPSSVAAESRLRGNSVTGLGQEGSQFTYGFQGLEAGAKLALRPSGFFELNIGGAWLKNLSAPNGINQGYLAFVESRIPLSNRVILSPRVEWYRNESDSAPGQYNSSWRAHNNRQGWIIGMNSRFPASELELDAQIARASVIEASPFQSDTTAFFLSLRKSHAWL